MKLLFDQNLSFKLNLRVQKMFSGSKHLTDLDLQNFSDSEIWEFAKSNHFTIVTCDSDFVDISVLRGFPPKVIWLRVGNTSTQGLIALFEREYVQIQEFLINDEVAYLELK